uniref:Uncharacterized protein n=1 Tax=Salmonella phage SalP219 TaxID=3158864 RepID=A0AAU7PI78_9CAUD
MLHTFPKEDFQREYNILKSLIPKGLMEILKRLDVRVAGGTLTSLFSNREVNDIDLYFPSWENLEIFLAYMTDRGLLSGDSDLTPATNNWGNSKRSFKYFRELDHPGSFNDYVNVLACEETKRPPTKASAEKLALLAKALEECSDETFKKIKSLCDEDDNVDYIENIGMTDKSVMFTNRKLPVLQCIAFDVFPDARKIFDKFDFTINMGAFSFAKGQWEFDKNFLKHVAQKVLVLNPKTDYPIISMLRADKYRARGYTISRRETMKLGIAVSGLKIESWEDAKAHLSGMYGTNVEELFNETKPFSFELLFDKLDRAGDVLISSIATESEKGSASTYSGLRPTNIFSMYQRLRKSTGRPYFEKLFGVCPAENFYMMQKHLSKHTVGLLKTMSAAEMLKFVNVYIDETEATDVYYTWGEKGKVDRWGDRLASPGAVLLEISIDDPTKIGYEDACVHLADKENTFLKVERVIDCNGDIS